MNNTTHTRTPPDEQEAAALRSASLAGEPVPTRILLAPWGKVASTNGDFVVDDESLTLAAAAFDEHGTDVPIDYEHQTLGGTYASPSGQAPAAGWIKRIVGENGTGVFAEIEWTRQALKLLTSKQYRYLSPVAIIRKADRKLVAIHSAALTNKPAIANMLPIVNRCDARDTAAIAQSIESLRTGLDLAGDAAPAAVLLAARQRIDELQRDAQQRRADERIAEAMRCGKLVPAQQAWARQLFECSETLFDQWLAGAPVVVSPGVTTAPSQDGDSQACSAVAARAKAEYRSCQLLAALTSETAYVADAIRQHQRTATQP